MLSDYVAYVGKFGLNVITNGNNFSVSFPRVLSKSFLGMAEALEN